MRPRRKVCQAQASPWEYLRKPPGRQNRLTWNTEAQNEAGEFFGEQRLLHVAQENLSGPAQILEDAVLAAVNRFSSAGAHCDDETMVIIKRQ